MFSWKMHYTAECSLGCVCVCVCMLLTYTDMYYILECAKSLQLCLTL